MGTDETRDLCEKALNKILTLKKANKSVFSSLTRNFALPLSSVRRYSRSKILKIFWNFTHLFVPLQANLKTYNIFRYDTLLSDSTKDGDCHGG